MTVKMHRTSRKPKVASAGLNNSRTYALYRAGRDLLAAHDLDHISIARIAKASDCSVGAFYERFPDKNAYLVFLVRNEFQAKKNALENRLPEIARRKSNRKSIIDEIAKFLADEFASEKTAGIVRVALKLAPTESRAILPITEYRDAANEAVFRILKQYMKSRDARQRIEESLQIVFSVIFDAIQQNYGPLKLNKSRMAAVLSRQFQARIADLSKLPSDGVISAGKKKATIKEIAIEVDANKKRRKPASTTQSARRRKVNVI